jgi:hypothetical protein
MSGYSAAVFVAYGAVAYNMGITIWFWWARGKQRGADQYRQRNGQRPPEPDRNAHVVSHRAVLC